MAIDAVIFVLRRGVGFGLVADILPPAIFEGKEAGKLKGPFVKVYTSDLDEALAKELKDRKKRFKTPSVGSAFYKDLDTKGFTVASNSEILEFIEVNNA